MSGHSYTRRCISERRSQYLVYINVQKQGSVILNIGGVLNNFMSYL